jgi:hypothetical protein
MRWLMVILLLVCTVKLAEAKTISQFVPLRRIPIPDLDAPPTHVSRWISIGWMGAVNHPIPSVFYVTEHPAPAGVLASYVYLTSNEYQVLQNFTGSTRCSREHVSDKPPYPNAIWIRGYSKGAVRDLCVFPAKGGCEYLSNLAALLDMNWAHKETYFFVGI